jgi:hypothetical protein
VWQTPAGQDRGERLVGPPAWTCKVVVLSVGSHVTTPGPEVKDFLDQAAMRNGREQLRATQLEAATG